MTQQRAAGACLLLGSLLASATVLDPRSPQASSHCHIWCPAVLQTSLKQCLLLTPSRSQNETPAPSALCCVCQGSALGLSLILEPTDSARLSGQQASESVLFPTSLVLDLQVDTAAPWFLCGCWRLNSVPVHFTKVNSLCSPSG